VIYALDTNVLGDALRQPAELDRLKAFLSWALPSTELSSVVVAELTAGARLHSDAWCCSGTGRAAESYLISNPS